MSTAHNTIHPTTLSGDLELKSEMKSCPTGTMWGMLLCPSISLIVLGIAAVMLPVVTSLATEIIFGMLMLIGGVGYALHARIAEGRSDRLWSIVWSVLYLMTGVTLLTDPMGGPVTLTLVIAFLFVFEGISKVMFSIRPTAGHHRLWLALDGLLGAGLGVMIWSHWPNDSSWVIGLLVGLRLLMAGILLTRLAMSLRIACDSTPV